LSSKSVKINIVSKLQAVNLPKIQPASLMGGQYCVLASPRSNCT